MLAIRILCAVLVVFSAFVRADTQPSLLSANELMRIDGERGLQALTSFGSVDPIVANGVDVIAADGQGSVFNLSSQLALAWPASGNLYARQGTLAFFFKTQEDLRSSPIPIFRVSSADSSTWDFDWLRIDWNGNGLEAFVTDIGLARLRIKSERLPPTLLDSWQHLAFAWDERFGIKLWLNGELLIEKQQPAHLDQGLWAMGPMQRIIAPWKVESGFSFDRTGLLLTRRKYMSAKQHT